VIVAAPVPPVALVAVAMAESGRVLLAGLPRRSVVAVAGRRGVVVVSGRRAVVAVCRRALVVVVADVVAFVARGIPAVVGVLGRVSGGM
jgi:hypothetical protein